jgi:hypothetical protein
MRIGASTRQRAWKKSYRSLAGVSRVEKRAAPCMCTHSKRRQRGPRPIFLLELDDFLQDKCQELHTLHHIHLSGLNDAFFM